MIHKVPQRRQDEEQTAYAIRVIQWETWWRAHDDFCDYGPQCTTHRSEYDDGQ